MGAVAMLMGFAPMEARAQETTVTFYDTLSPYGDWVVVEQYGRVWRPSSTVVGVNFVPYASGGRWVHSNVGWVFEPEWNWGWLPFHYGRWYQDPFNGWVWVPDNVWAPAWVEWRVGGGYIGWAPAAPRYHVHARPNWYFVENRHFVEPQVWQHRAVAVNTERVMEVTRPVAPPAGQAWARGPQVTEVRAATQLPVPERKLEAPRQPMQVFPQNLPPAAPPPSQRREQPALPEPSQRLQPPPETLQRAPEQQLPPQRANERMGAPPAAVTPMPQQMAPQPMQRGPQPMPQAEPMRRGPDPIQRAPQPMQRAPEPMPQAEPMRRGPDPIQRGPAPMQRTPSMERVPPPSMQRTPSEFPATQRTPMQQAPAPAPAPMQQAPAPTPVRKVAPMAPMAPAPGPRGAPMAPLPAGPR